MLALSGGVVGEVSGQSATWSLRRAEIDVWHASDDTLTLGPPGTCPTLLRPLS